MNPALSVREALKTQQPLERTVPTAGIAEDFAKNFGGVPATSFSRPERTVLYHSNRYPVLLGLYGDEHRVRSWLPGLPERITPETARDLLLKAIPPRETAPPPQVEVSGLSALPVLKATPRDAGPFVTMGLLCAHTADGEELALSVHRMLVLDDERLTLWMVPGRQLRAAYDEATARGDKLAVTINIGAPPAALIASALGSRFLPHGKLDIAGALAGSPIGITAAKTQPAWAIAESEIVIEGYLDGSTGDEHGDISLPEFLGYDGGTKTDVPVIRVTRITARESALYQAVIGPGREQSVILGLAGAVSAALSEKDDGFIRDLHFSPAGGGMLMLAASVVKRGPGCDRRLAPMAQRLFAAHPFVKLIVFVDDDVEAGCAEDVLWAMTTRCNLGTDTTTLTGFTGLGMDPSQRADWAAYRGAGGELRTWIDATVPFRLRDGATRSFR